jgi:hypothetical protein
MHLGQTTVGWDEVGAYDTPTSVAVSPDQVPADAQTSSDWTTALPQIVGAVTQWDMARQLNELNLQRVQQGLPPITAQEVTPGVNVGLSSQTQTLVLIGLAVIVGLVVFMKKG